MAKANKVRTLQAAIKCRITQEMKFLYKKKQKLNEQLHHPHPTCATEWQEQIRDARPEIAP
jgi:hypothetical protein